jgi:hypothetical protein
MSSSQLTQNVKQILKFPTECKYKRPISSQELSFILGDVDAQLAKVPGFAIPPLKSPEGPRNIVCIL